ncbi:MAG: tetraacyldisaccharide 4'-kinase [Halofilum sp. (in: g-proteobacteria)]|nr:tetraacyldisaccharide 4'-kinase [Halofilum sp. (in: g-proteobacteria)]
MGNARLLPAGPLREPARRLRTVDWVAVRDGEMARRPATDRVTAEAHRAALAQDHADENGTLAEWRGRRVHAVAGIGVPERFFGQLEDAGLAIRAPRVCRSPPLHGAGSRVRRRRARY